MPVLLLVPVNPPPPPQFFFGGNYPKNEDKPVSLQVGRLPPQHPPPAAALQAQAGEFAQGSAQRGRRRAVQVAALRVRRATDAPWPDSFGGSNSENRKSLGFQPKGSSKDPNSHASNRWVPVRGPKPGFRTHRTSKIKLKFDFWWVQFGEKQLVLFHPVSNSQKVFSVAFCSPANSD